MNILIVPAAGQGQRFRDAGYEKPKPLLYIPDPQDLSKEVPMLVAAARPFINWADLTVLVIPRMQQLDYLDEWDVIRNGLSDAYIEHCSLAHQQEGAALTILSLLGEIPDDAQVLIVNSDQFFIADVAPWLAKLNSKDAPDGSLLTFESGADPRWSYAQTAPHDPLVVTRVAEKIAISTHATAGAYFFRQWKVLRTAICRMVGEGERYNGEFYLAPTYNQLIRAGMSVTRYDVSGGIVGVGTPELYVAWRGQHWEL